MQRDRAATCEGHLDTELSEGWCYTRHQALTSQAPEEMHREHSCLFLFYSLLFIIMDDNRTVGLRRDRRVALSGGPRRANFGC